MTREEIRNATWNTLSEINLPVYSVTCGVKQEEKQQAVVLVRELRDQERANEIIKEVETKKPSNATLKVSHDKWGFTIIRLYFQYQEVAQ